MAIAEKSEAVNPIINDHYPVTTNILLFELISFILASLMTINSINNDDYMH